MNATIRKLILFVQGPETPGNLWDKLIGLVQKSPEIAQDHHCFPYDTVTGSDDLAAVTNRFAGWYATRKAEYLNSDIVLVGHGLGGIVIQNFIAQKLEHGLSRDFFNLRQLILYAVPHLGYEEIPKPTRLMSRLGGNPLVSALKKWDSDLPTLNERIHEFVINPVDFNSYYRPISVQCFGGSDDRLVTPESAQGNWPVFDRLTGNYTSVVEPDTEADGRFTRFRDCLVSPPPHKGIYYVDTLETVITVEPFAAGHYEARYGQHTRWIETDNYGTIFRRVKFAPANACFQPYPLRYSIENEQGFICATPSGGLNVTAPKNQQLYEARGLEYYFEFIPEPDRTYGLLIELYKGFDEGFRDAHFHLGNGSTRVRTFQITLDLSRYLDSNYRITREPTLMLHPEDSHSCDDRFSERSDERIIPLASADCGCWTWEINDIGGGVIDLFWDLEAY